MSEPRSAVGRRPRHRGDGCDPLDVVTVVGNLLDNAVRAAAEGSRRPAWVEVAVAADDADLQVAVTDSGAGLADSADAATAIPKRRQLGLCPRRCI